MHENSLAILIFLAFVGFTLGLSFWLGRKAKSSAGYFAAHGEIGPIVNGVAFAGDYLSAASFLGICGMIAFYGYDGFLYSIGFLAGWVVALFVIAEPIKRLGKYTFADALNAKFNSRGITLAAAISTLVVSIFYLIPQMVGAGALLKALLGIQTYLWHGIDLSHALGVVVVGALVITIVCTAGMVSTTWVQFIKGSLLVVFCSILTVMILGRGLKAASSDSGDRGFRQAVPRYEVETSDAKRLPREGAWKGKPYARFQRPDGSIATYRLNPPSVAQYFDSNLATTLPGWSYDETQTVTARPDGTRLVNGLPSGTGPGQATLRPMGTVLEVGTGDARETGSLGPARYVATLGDSTVETWVSETLKEADGSATIVYTPTPRRGDELLLPGGSPTFKGIRSPKLTDRLDFVSLMLALFCGTASLPHILIRYYTVKNVAAARLSTVVGIGVIGFFYVLTLYIGLGAMVSGNLDPTDSNMAAPLLAKTFGNFMFAIISAIAFTTVLGTVSGLILAAAGAVAHDLVKTVLGHNLEDRQQVKIAKIASVAVGILAILLGILAKDFNVTFLVGWAFNVAASANLPAIVMILFWRGATKQGIIASITVGLITSVTWLMLSAPAYTNLYKLPATSAIAPFTQPGLVTIPLSFAVLVIVSLLTKRREARGFAVNVE